MDFLIRTKEERLKREMNIYNNRKKIQHLKILIFIFIIMILLMKYVEFNTYGDTTDLNSDEYTINNTNINNIIKSNVTFTIITGASSNHFCPLKAFLYNIHETLEGFNYSIIIYDLGLSRGQRNMLKRLKKLNYLSDLKSFNFSKYPSFWNIKEGRGEYAWKPAIIKEVSEDYPGILIWSDSGTKIERFFFEKLKKFDKRFDGFVSPTSPGLMEDWTHPGVYDYYNDDHSKYAKLVNCNGAFVMFNTHKVQHLIDQWYDCALIKDCIAPPGSSRINHRQDQSILTYLAARDNRYCNEDRKLFGVTTHEDRNCKDVITNYENNLYFPISDNV